MVTPPIPLCCFNLRKGIKKIKNKAKLGGAHKPSHIERNKRLRHNASQIIILFFILWPSSVCHLEINSDSESEEKNIFSSFVISSHFFFGIFILFYKIVYCMQVKKYLVGFVICVLILIFPNRNN